jgi:hypothetical protein
MNSSNKDRAFEREPKAGAPDEAASRRTPNADMQADDAGTAESGNEDSQSDAGTAMKQTSRTGQEAA